MNNEAEFKAFLSKEPTITSSKAISSRVVKVNNAEVILKEINGDITLDDIVANDDLMYDSLLALQPHENPKHTPMQNALRKYYKFRNGCEFPRLRDYKR